MMPRCSFSNDSRHNRKSKQMVDEYSQCSKWNLRSSQWRREEVDVERGMLPDWRGLNVRLAFANQSACRIEPQPSVLLVVIWMCSLHLSQRSSSLQGSVRVDVEAVKRFGKEWAYGLDRVSSLASNLCP